MVFAAITTDMQVKALAYLISNGYLAHCKGMTLDMVQTLPVASRLVNLHAMLIGQGKHPSVCPRTARLMGLLPVSPPTPPRPARPPPPRPKPHYFDARSAAAGDLSDQEDD